MTAGALAAAKGYQSARLPPIAASGPRHKPGSYPSKTVDAPTCTRRFDRMRRSERFRRSCAAPDTRRDKSSTLAFGDAADAISDVNRSNRAARDEPLQRLY